MTPTKVLVNAPHEIARHQHPTQPDDKLVPTTVKIDEEGNPLFTYKEPTPTKLSPNIVAPKSLLNRLKKKGKRNSKCNKMTSGVENLDSRQKPQEHTPVVSLHESFSFDDYDEEDTQSVQSSSSFGTRSVAGSVTSLSSLSKMKLRLRRNRGRKKEILSPLSPLKELKEADLQKPQVFKKKYRRSSNTSHTSSTCRSSTSLLDMDVPSPSAPHTPRVLGPAFKSTVPSLAMEEDLTIPVAVRVLTPSRTTVTPAAVTAPAPIAALMDAAASAPKIVAIRPKGETSACESKRATNSRRTSPPIVPQHEEQREQEPPKSKSSVSVVSRVTISKSPSATNPSPTASAASTLTSAPPNTSSPSFKIFLLLLHPTSKIFELIQLFFDPTKTSVRDIISMIPDNATEVALGAQPYTGLCRPNGKDEDEDEISNLELLAQNNENMAESAQIVRGETLVAIPDGYTGAKVANLSQQILCNPRICRLLKSSDPLAPRSKKRSSRNRRRRRSSTLKSVEVLDKHDEDKPTLSESVQVAMQKAEQAAAVANAAVHELPRNRGLVTAVGKTYRYAVDRHGKVAATGPDGMSLENALRSLDTSAASASLTDFSERSFSLQSYENSIDQSEYSMDKSLSSWSRSLDTSFMRSAGNMETATLSTNRDQAPMITTHVSRKRNKQLRQLRRVAVGVALLVYTIYWADPNGFARRHGRVDRIMEQPMGLTGLMQVILVFLSLTKLQFLCSMPSWQISNCFNKRSRCPFMKSRASFLECSNQGRSS